MKKNEIRNAHLLFEQSGTFKKEFQKLGITAFDYDIQNEYGQTDFVIDLFAEIEKAWQELPSLFDLFSPEDLVMAFFPCIHFEAMAMMYYDGSTLNIKSWDKHKKWHAIIEKLEEREKFYKLIYKLYAVCDMRGLRLVIENPATKPHYLLDFQNFPPPTFIDKNRALRGDFYKKPTAYWFVNFEPTHGHTLRPNPTPKTVNGTRGSAKKGMCGAERSQMSPTYAHLFIIDYILGEKERGTQLDLFG